MKDHSCSGSAKVRLAAELMWGQIWVAELNLEGGQVHVVMELSEGWKGADSVGGKDLGKSLLAFVWLSWWCQLLPNHGRG